MPKKVKVLLRMQRSSGQGWRLEVWPSDGKPPYLIMELNDNEFSELLAGLDVEVVARKR